MSVIDRAIWRLVTREARQMPASNAYLRSAPFIRPAGKRWLVEANIAAMVADWDRAVPAYLKALHHAPADLRVIISFGSMLAAQGDTVRYGQVWQALGGAAALSDAAQMPIARLLFVLDVGLRVEDPAALACFEAVYLRDRLLADRLPGRPRRAAIFFWHVPKCGGTSFNAALSKLFYRSGLEQLPNYHTPHVMHRLLAGHMGEVPFLSSAHMPLRDLPVIPADVAQIAILRDPARRALSAWRQYREAPEARLMVLPQHGMVWNALPVADLGDWVRRCPEAQINKMSHSFDVQGDPLRAARRVGQCAHVLDLSQLNDQLPALCEALGVALPELPRGLNASPKHIGYSADEMADLHAALGADRALYDAVFGGAADMRTGTERPA